MSASNDEQPSGSGEIGSVDWASVYRTSSLQGCAERYRADPRRYEWLALGRGLEARLGVEESVFRDCRSEVPAEPMPVSTVFILGAADGPPPGCLGHVAARMAYRTIGVPPVAESIERISGTSSLVEPLVNRLVEVVRPLAPDVAAPRLEIVSPMEGVGGSHALAVAISALHALIGAEVPPGTGATGGFDLERGRFRPVPPETLVSKAQAAVRWGVKRILVVEDQQVPDEARIKGLDWIECPSEPAALPLHILFLADVGESDEMDPRVLQALRLSLALYDLQVARSLETPLETVMEVTRPFFPEGDTDGVDPVLAFLAADIRSRALLHAGRSVESASWYRRAVSLLGRGDLPTGVLGDHLLYEHPAHASVLAMDLGVLESDGDDGEPHRQLDAAIADLEGRWCTRHQVLLRMFARNTRWRRHLHLARWRLDPELLDHAEKDLLAEQKRWHELLDLHATDQLGMGNSELSRQRNYMLDHLVAVAALQDPARYADRRGGPPESIRDRLLATPELVEEIRSRASNVRTLSTFDLRGLLQGWWLLGEGDDESLDRLDRSLEGRGPGFRHARWAEWWWRLGSTPHGLALEVLRDEVVRHQSPPGGGIGRIMALRRAMMLDQGGDAGGASAGRWLESIATPDGPATLVEAFEDLRSDPALIIVRTPY